MLTVNKSIPNAQIFQDFCNCPFLLYSSGPVSVATVTAQSMGKAQSMKVDNLSDEQVLMMMQRAKSMGYSDQNIVQYAKSEGLSSLEITKLSGRINKIRNEENKRKRTFSNRQEEKKKELLADETKQSASTKKSKN